MDKQEAKLILSSYTLGNEPEKDAKFEAAMSFAQNDAELREWWETQKSTDQSLAQALQKASVPDDLRSALHATVEESSRKRTLFVQFRKWASIAAALVMCSYIFFEYGIDRSDDYQGPLVERAYNYSADGPRLKYFNKDTSSLRTWLTSNGIAVPKQLPPKLLELEGIGCRPLDWSEERVALMCFNAETVYHLYIGMAEDFPEFDASEEIGYSQYAGDWTVSKWKADEYLFVLTAQAEPDQMQQYLASYDPSDVSNTL